MKRAIGSGLVLISAAAVTGAAAWASTSVTGIPGNCTMTVHRAKLDPTGKPVGDPATILEAKMVGGWAQRAFRRSWDGKVVLSHTFDGFRVSKGAENVDYKIQLFHRNFWWGPDSKKFMFWIPSGIAVANVDDLGPAGAAPKHTIVYRPPGGHYPMGIAWAPTGSHIFVSESYEVDGKATKTAIRKIPADGGTGTAILDSEEVIFYMPADTWYEDGSGAKAKTSPILYGTKSSLWYMNSDGGDQTKLCDIPCMGLADIMWEPTGKNEFLLLWRKGFADATKKVWRGLYRFNLDAAKKAAAEKKTNDWSFVEPIQETDGIHTLFYSGKGKHIAFADTTLAYVKEMAKAGEKPVKVEIPGSAGVVKGVSWDDKEQKLAVAIGNKLSIYDLASRAVTPVAQVSERGFIAEPFWRGDELVYSSFVDLDEKKKLPPPPPPPPGK